MVAGVIRIVDEYVTANIRERIEIILNNYPDFLGIMDDFEESLKYLIISGRKVAKCRGREDLGVRVQTSGFSDPTANATVDSVMLTEAIRSENMDAGLKGIECPKQYRKEAEVIREMRGDCFLVKAQIKALPWQDYRVLDSYPNRSHDLVKLAEEAGCTYDGVENWLKRTRSRIRESTALYLERKYENS